MSCTRIGNIIGTRPLAKLVPASSRLYSAKHTSYSRIAFASTSQFSTVTRSNTARLSLRNLRLLQQNNRVIVNTGATSIRHCSCRRMCKRDDHASNMDVTKGREILPANVKPKHYDITLEPDLEGFTYKGKVIIE